MKKILIVDPQIGFSEEWKAELAREFLVNFAEDVNTALEKATDDRPDLIILDVENLEDLNHSIYLKIKENIKTKYIPLILICAKNDLQEIVDGKYDGAEDYLTKPIEIDNLIGRLNSYLRTKDFYSDLSKKDLLMLLELMETISITRSHRKIFQIIIRKLVEAIDVARCSILGINDQGELVVLASSDLPEGVEIKMDIAKYPEIERALSTRRPVLLQDISCGPLLEPVREKIKGLPECSIFVVPIIKKENVIGTLFLRTASHSADAMTERIFKLCQVIGGLSGNALETAIIFESMKSSKIILQDISVRDSLTNLYNHQFYHTRLMEEFNRAQRYKTELSCIFLDVDNFKVINDTHGHFIGDIVLRQIGRNIADIIRKSDIAARYGGEEFALLLPNTSSEGAHESAERLQEKIRNLSIEQLNGKQITVSIGISTYKNGNLSSCEELLKAADQNMYEAKRAGKDRIFRTAN
jgi:two-component system, cell cycle response regulator